MLWLEKFRPKSFKEMTTHSDLVTSLESYTIETVPHLILYGKNGSGKRTILYSLIKHLFGDFPEVRYKKTEIETSSDQKMEIEFYESDEYIEINPSVYGYKDKFIVQTLIKQFAQTKPILNFFTKNKRLNTKLVVIMNAEKLSKDAQAGLRRTVEQYSSSFRIILLCEQLSTIIEPIRSRFLSMRVNACSFEEVALICKSILKKEGCSYKEEMVKMLYNESNGNLERILSLLEINNLCSQENKRIKTEILKNEWETKIEKIIHSLIKEHNISSLKSARDEFYNLIGSCVPPSLILLEMVKLLRNKVSFFIYTLLLEKASVCDQRIKLGSKAILHLECFAAYLIYLLDKKE